MLEAMSLMGLSYNIHVLFQPDAMLLQHFKAFKVLKGLKGFQGPFPALELQAVSIYTAQTFAHSPNNSSHISYSKKNQLCFADVFYRLSLHGLTIFPVA